MSLRARMGLAAGVAVALAVIAVAVVRVRGHALAAARSDRQLAAAAHRATRCTTAPGAPGGLPAGAPGTARARRPVAFGGGPSRGSRRVPGHRRRGPRPRPPRCPFGGAAGIITLIYPNGGTYVPPGQSYEIPPDAPMKALAKSGRASYYTEMHVAARTSACSSPASAATARSRSRCR